MNCPVLGLPYDCSLDTWSIGCTLYELYTAKILFPGRNNNQMLLHIQEVKGKLSNKFIKKGRFTDMHFDESGAFLSSELNKTTGTVCPMHALADQAYCMLLVYRKVSRSSPYPQNQYRISDLVS